MLVLFLCLAAAVVLFVFVSIPIRRGRDADSVPGWRAVPGAPGMAAEGGVAGLPSSGDWQMNALLQQIKEIELDFHAGKLSSRDHDLLKKFYEGKAAELLTPKK